MLSVFPALVPALMPVVIPALGAAVGLGVPVALHVASWGAFKDSPYEGYHPSRQARTLVMALLAALVVVASGVVGTGAVLPALGVVYSLERLATEWWKAIVRSDDQAAYAIPMRLGFRGRPVDDPAVRWAVGVAVVVGLVLAWLGVVLAQHGLGTSAPGWLVVLTVGGLGGWLTAVGGAWKDAPVEGFSGWKFLRSPVVATAWAFPLSTLTHSWATLSLAAAGMAVASIETYKTFLTGGRPPGKFAGKAAQPVRPGLKRTLGRAHATGWAALGAVALVQMLAVTGPVPGIPAMVAAMIAAACGLTAVVVLSAASLLTDGAAASAGPLGTSRDLRRVERVDIAA